MSLELGEKNDAEFASSVHYAEASVLLAVYRFNIDRW